MALQILVVTSTETEAEAVRRIKGIKSSSEGLILGNCNINLLTTGIGSIQTAWGMSEWLSSNPKPFIAVNAGIAGSYHTEIEKGTCVVTISDCFADQGIEDHDKFLTLADAGLADANRYPFKDGTIISENKYTSQVVKYIRPVRAITVNTASGCESTIRRLTQKYNPDIETMEGATFFYICAMEMIPFLSIRAISNIVEPRDKSKWDIPGALNGLSVKLKDIFLMLD